MWFSKNGNITLVNANAVCETICQFENYNLRIIAKLHLVWNGLSYFFLHSCKHEFVRNMFAINWYD